MIHKSCVLAVGVGVGDFGDWSPMKKFWRRLLVIANRSKWSVMIIDFIIYISYYRIRSIYYLYYDFIWFPSFSTVLSVYMSNYVCFNMFKKSAPKLPNEKIFKERTSMAPTTIGAYRWGERVRSWLSNWDKPPEHSWESKGTPPMPPKTPRNSRPY